MNDKVEEFRENPESIFNFTAEDMKILMDNWHSDTEDVDAEQVISKMGKLTQEELRIFIKAIDLLLEAREL